MFIEAAREPGAPSVRRALSVGELVDAFYEHGPPAGGRALFLPGSYKRGPPDGGVDWFRNSPVM
jgi:hypothetical protein